MKKKIFNKISPKVGMKIKLERTKKKMTQNYLADISGISQPTIGVIERGENSPSIDTVAAIANALEIELYKLFIFDE